jgi:hypothetical protein
MQDGQGTAANYSCDARVTVTHHDYSATEVFDQLLRQDLHLLDNDTFCGALQKLRLSSLAFRSRDRCRS